MGLSAVSPAAGKVSWAQWRLRRRFVLPHCVRRFECPSWSCLRPLILSPASCPFCQPRLCMAASGSAFTSPLSSSLALLLSFHGAVLTVFVLSPGFSLLTQRPCPQPVESHLAQPTIPASLFLDWSAQVHCPFTFFDQPCDKSLTIATFLLALPVSHRQTGASNKSVTTNTPTQTYLQEKLYLFLVVVPETSRLNVLLIVKEKFQRNVRHQT